MLFIDSSGLATFGYYGNWGGPGRVNGKTRKSPSHPNRRSSGWRETDHFPRRGDPGFVEPIDLRDEAYYNHDVCISSCAQNNCKDSAINKCVAICDIMLSNNPNIPEYERDFFRWYHQYR